MNATLSNAARARAHAALITFGPFERAPLSGLCLALHVEGDRIMEAQVRNGFAHQGLAELAPETYWRDVPRLAARLDAMAPIACAAAATAAIERLLGVAPTPRGRNLRAALLEIERADSHCANLGAAMHDLGLAALGAEATILSRDLHTLSSALLAAPPWRALVAGGVAFDLDERQARVASEMLSVLRARAHALVARLDANPFLQRRLSGVGQLEAAAAQAAGLSGPAIRAAGAALDLRLRRGDERSLGSAAVVAAIGGGEIPEDFRPETASASDALARHLLRAREAVASLLLAGNILFSTKEGAVGWPTTTAAPTTLPAGEITVEIESPRGALGLHLVSRGGEMPASFAVRSPSRALIDHLPTLLAGARYSDLRCILISLDLSLTEAEA